jgi:hypothetical protein
MIIGIYFGEDCDGEDPVLNRLEKNGWMDGWIVFIFIYPVLFPSIHPSIQGLNRTLKHVLTPHVLTVLAVLTIYNIHSSAVPSIHPSIHPSKVSIGL